MMQFSAVGQILRTGAIFWERTSTIATSRSGTETTGILLLGKLTVSMVMSFLSSILVDHHVCPPTLAEPLTRVLDPVVALAQPADLIFISLRLEPSVQTMRRTKDAPKRSFSQFITEGPDHGQIEPSIEMRKGPDDECK
jgi:hypothetical protein